MDPTEEKNTTQNATTPGASLSQRLPSPRVLGIDPGLSGGIAIVSAKPFVLGYQVHMPIEKRSGRPQVCGGSLARLLSSLHPEKIQIAAIEDVSAMPEQGVTSTFRFGYGAGVVRGVCDTLAIPVILIKPSVWKVALNLTRDKADSVALANKLFGPHFKKRDDGPAEAALIAYFVATRILPSMLPLKSIYD